MRKLFVVSLLAALCGAASGVARADTCLDTPRFNDVDPESEFCTDSAWLANRSITLGCGFANFCPYEYVTRAQMALFMRRLAFAMMPITLSMNGGSGAFAPQLLDPVDPASVYCKTEPYPTGWYPKLLAATSNVTASQASAGLTVAARIVYSLDLGVTWLPAGPITVSTVFAAMAPPHAVTTTQFASVIELPAAKHPRFGVQIGRQEGTGTVEATCALRASMLHANGSVPPYY